MFTHQDIIHAESERQTAMIANEPLASPTPSAPILSPASNGFWWLWHEGEWCCAAVTHEPERRFVSEHLRVTWINEERISYDNSLSVADIAALQWGGRITPPARL